MILGISGDIGSFSEDAAIKYKHKTKDSLEFKYLIDIDNVLSSLENKTINFGIFPVVNLNGGLVKTAFDAMGKYKFRVVDEIWLDIDHHLITNHSVNFQEINKIISHPQAFAQCKKYLKKHFPKAEYIEWRSTALAARNLSEGTFDSNTAVIGHKKTSHIYNLKVVAESIQDKTPNLTAFIVVESF